jgi:hypothetical protein
MDARRLSRAPRSRPWPGRQPSFPREEEAGPHLARVLPSARGEGTLGDAKGNTPVKVPKSA